jgi:DNA invertase Pin-like site-specific DNA recombinase
MRVLLYARYSTEKQDALSIATRLTMCREVVRKNGWTEIGCFTDEAVSGATRHRPGFQALMTDMDRLHPDIVFADAIDRLSKSQADIATFYERLTIRGIQLVTRKEGVVTPMHIGMMDTINAQQVSATADKTRDALRHQMAKNPGGIAYGYEKRIEHDAAGERIRGLLAIVPGQAAVIEGIFEDYAAGVPPKRISNRLNAEGVPPPGSGKRPGHAKGKSPAWGPNTITGNVARGTGILNNELYAGRRRMKSRPTGRTPTPGNAMPSCAATTTAPSQSRCLRSVSSRTSYGSGSRTVRPASPESRSAGPRATRPSPSSHSSGRNTC